MLLAGGLDSFGPIGTVGHTTSLIAGGTAFSISILIGIAPILAISRKKHNSPLPYSKLGQKAIDFARKELRQCRGIYEIKPYLWKSESGEIKHQPVNKEIPLIRTLQRIACIHAIQAIEKYQNMKDDEPQELKEIFQAIDRCIKLSYALGCLMLDDLPAFTARLKEKGDSRRYMEALTAKDSYLRETFCYFHGHYHWLRNMGLPKEIPLEMQEKYNAYVKGFYSPGIKNDWRLLYNEYCGRIKSYVSNIPRGDAMYTPKYSLASNPDFSTWTKEDEDPATFILFPKVRHTPITVSLA